jgi:MFS family permease
MKGRAMRKIIVTTISVLYMLIALGSFASSFFPSSFSSGLIVLRFGPFGINLAALMMFYAGMLMLRFNEFGRQLFVAALSIGIVMRVVSGLWLCLSYQSGCAGLALNYLGAEIYRYESPFAYPALLLAWVLVHLWAIVFLSQKETRKIFVPETEAAFDSGGNNSNDNEVESDVLI